MAVIAFVLAFVLLLVMSIVGGILGIIAFREVSRTGERGRGLAVAAIWIGFVFFAINATIATVLAVHIVTTSGTY
jgi:hypothetical protein